MEIMILMMMMMQVLMTMMIKMMIKMEKMMMVVQVSPWNNHWWNIHDFSPVEGGSNWARLGQMFKVSRFAPNIPSIVD